MLGGSILGAIPCACPGALPTDAGAVDAGAVDAGADAGVPDAGEPEPSDAGPQDAGVDAGAPFDAGPPPPVDAGPLADAGPTAATYWSGVDLDASGATLVAALHTRLEFTHDRVRYDDLWDAYTVVDQGRGCGAEIYDFYSDRCWAPSEKCGQYAQEGDCFNREHSWPKSWWGGREGTDAFSDLYVLLPTDGFVNGQRANWPFGEVSNASYTSSNGSVLGTCSDSVVSNQNCFAPILSLRGDLARAYFYFAVRYQDEFSCCDREANNGADIDPWQEAVLRDWHEDDPVDDDERTRTERVFLMQGNRNPFVDYPSLVDAISDF